MAPAMRVFRKFQSSDGRIKILTLSGVSALVAVIALLVGVLPVFATDGSFDESDKGVHPEEVQYGGGPGACDSVDSDASFELHINKPANDTFKGPDGTQVTITLDEEDPRIFSYDFVGDPAVMAAYDVVVNGGPHNLWYDNDGQVGSLQSDGNLHAPRKNNDDLNNLSHINICYDVATVTFVCDGGAEDAFRFGDGIFVEATGQIFNNSTPNVGCVEGDDKQGTFFIDNEAEEATLDFGDEGVVAGRLDVTKDFTEDSTPNDPTDFEDLEYDPDGEGFVVVQWCETRDFVDGEDGDQFSDWLLTTGDDASYPDLPSGETACKVAEDEDLSGTQVTVVYFEFEDPNFR